jgi:hypothetical protein
MVVSAGGVPRGAQRGTGSPAGSGPEPRSWQVTRRRLLVSFAALALTPLLAASRAPRSADGSETPEDPDATDFDEIYQGRRIRGARVTAADCGAEGQEWHVTVDGHPLHLMLRADGSWLTMVDHYCSYPTALEATRAAVDELGPGQRLREPAPGPFGGRYPHRGAPHGVRA